MVIGILIALSNDKKRKMIHKILTILLITLSLSNLVFGQTERSWKEKCLTNNQYEDRYASYSPNGKWIVFESNRDGNWEIYLMDYNGKNQERLTKNKADDRRPSWHPEENKILITTYRNGYYQICALELSKT